MSARSPAEAGWDQRVVTQLVHSDIEADAISRPWSLSFVDRPIEIAMIRCIPKGICSWDFRLDASGHSASIEFNWTSEQGTLVIDGEHFDIRKHGLFSGYWTMVSNSEKVATAQKLSAFTRTFELGTTSGTATLSAESAFGRTMLLKGAGFDAVIAPAHPFTRRASITGTIADFRTACFAFWLTGLLWRRAAQSSQS